MSVLIRLRFSNQLGSKSPIRSLRCTKSPISPPHVYKASDQMARSVCRPPNSIPSIFCNMYLSDSIACTKPDQMARSLNWILFTWSRARDHWKGNSSTRNPEQFSTSQVSEKKKMYLDVLIIARDHWKRNNSTRTPQELMPGKEKNNLDVRIIAAHLLCNYLDREMNNFKLWILRCIII